MIEDRGEPRDLPPARASLAVAEVFYKFHSFTLETLAFLATWYALRRVARFLARVS